MGSACSDCCEKESTPIEYRNVDVVPVIPNTDRLSGRVSTVPITRQPFPARTTLIDKKPFIRKSYPSQAEPYFSGMELSEYFMSNSTTRSDYPKTIPAYFDISRVEAEKTLFSPGKNNGMYILRPSEDKKSFALSLLIQDKEKKVSHVDHYRVWITRDRMYTLDKILLFSTIDEFLRHYIDHFNMSIPCPRETSPTVKLVDFEISRQALMIGEKIGHGAFGDVFEALLNGQLKVAVKVSNSSVNRELFIEEARLLSQMHHPNIVQLLGVCNDPPGEPTLIVMELMAKRSLSEYILTGRGKMMTFDEQLMCVYQVSDGMKYLEIHKYIHRDLRAGNILVDHNNIMKVADFGLSYASGRGIDDTKNYKFPVRWTAPEAYLEHRFSIKSDVWSYGILLYEVFSRGRQPFQGIEGKDIAQRAMDGFLMLNPIPPSVQGSKKMYLLMCDCWNIDANRRPSFLTIHKRLSNWFVDDESLDGYSDSSTLSDRD